MAPVLVPAGCMMSPLALVVADERVSDLTTEMDTVPCPFELAASSVAAPDDVTVPCILTALPDVLLTIT